MPAAVIDTRASAMILGGRIKSHRTDDGRPMDGQAMRVRAVGRSVALMIDTSISRNRPRDFRFIKYLQNGRRGRVDRFICPFSPCDGPRQGIIIFFRFYPFAITGGSLSLSLSFRSGPFHRVYAAFCSFSGTMCLAVGAVRTSAVH